VHDKGGPVRIEGPKRKNQKRKRNQPEKEIIIVITTERERSKRKRISSNRRPIKEESEKGR
jgi:hypothetical protein